MNTAGAAAIIVASMAVGGVIGWAASRYSTQRRKNPEKFGKRLRREIHAEQRKEERERIARLRQALVDTKAFRALALADFRERCRGELAGARELRQIARRQRAEALDTCRTGRDELDAETKERVRGAKRELREERRYQREIHRAEKRGREKERVRRSRKEASAESDDEVRANIPLELVPVFDRVKRQIKGTERKTRTEAFLEWTESHPDEVLAAEAEAAELEAERMWLEHESAA